MSQERNNLAAAALAQLAGDIVSTAGQPPVAAAEKGLTLSQFARQFLTGADAGLGGDAAGGPSDPYRQSLWFSRCVSKKAASVARVQVRLSRGEAAGTRRVWALRHCRAGGPRGRAACRDKSADAPRKAREGEIVETGPLAEFLERPNPDQRWNEFIEATMICLDVYGRVHWVFDELAGRRPVSMAVIPGSRSEPVVNKSGLVERLAGWMIRDPRHNRHFVNVAECITFQYFDPSAPFAGLSPRMPGRLAIIADYNASLYNAAMFANSCEPGTVLSTDAPFDPESDQQVRTAWQQRHAGAANARRLAILWGGLKHNSVSQTLQEMVYPEGKQFSREEICAITDVPASVAGFFGRSGDSDAYVSGERVGFWQDTVGPMLDKFADAIAAEIAPRFDGRLDAWFDVEDLPIFQELRRERLKASDPLWNKGTPLADVSDMLDLGVPERPQHQVGWLPIGVQPAADAIAGIAPPPDGEAPPDADDIADESERTAAGADGPKRASDKRPGAAAVDLAAVKAAADRLWLRWFNSWQGPAKTYARTVRARCSALQRQILAALRDAGPRIGLAASGGAAEKADPRAVLRIALSIVEGLDGKRQFRARTESVLRQAAEIAAEQVAGEAGLTGAPAASMVARVTGGPTIGQIIATERVRLPALIDASIRRQLRLRLAAVPESGGGFAEMADAIGQAMDTSRERALRAARNAVGQATSQSRRAAASGAGMTAKWWMHSRGPGERRPGHVAAESHYKSNPIGIDEPFVVNGAALMVPRDPSGPANETINCQCVAMYVRPPAGPKSATAAEAVLDVERLVEAAAAPPAEETNHA